MRALLLLLLILEGCKPHIVEVPVMLPRPIVILDPEPHLAIFNLRDKSTPPEVFKAYVATYYQQKEYIDYLKSLINQ